MAAAVLAIPCPAQTAPRKEPVSAQAIVARGSWARASRPLPPSLKWAAAVAPRRHGLGALTLNEAARLDPSATPPRTGTHRNLDASAMSQGGWDTAADGGRVWRLELDSPGATGLRVHFEGFDVGAGQVWIHSGTGQADGPYSGKGIFGDGDFWSGMVRGAAIVVEYQPEGAAAAAMESVPFRIGAVSHQARPTEAAGGGEAGLRPRLGRMTAAASGGLPAPMWSPDGFVDTASGCHLDPHCYPEWGDSYKAVGEIIFETPDGYQGACSGALLATRDNSGTPYFLTANHCINDDSAARSIVAFWHHETGGCGGGAPGDWGPYTLGATLLFHAAVDQFDAALLLMNGVSDGVVFAGWDPADPEIGSTVAGIHHPRASYKRFSVGVRGADATVAVGDSLAQAADYMQVNWTWGRLEPGSSGSPLFSGPGVVVGTASYSLISTDGTVCDIPGLSGYGRFSKLYPYVLNYLENALVTAVPSQLTFTGRNGVVAGSSTQTLSLRTQSKNPTTYSVSVDAPWVDLSPISGTVSAAAPGTVAVKINPKLLVRAGSYYARISLASGVGTPQQILVRFNMTIDRSSVAVSVSPNPVPAETAGADGAPWKFKLRVAESAGVATNITRLRVNGQDYSAQIVPWFGTARLGEFGTLEVELRSRNLLAPTTQYFEVGGADVATGLPWNMTIPVQFLGSGN
jgi:hypothetical protein